MAVWPALRGASIPQWGSGGQWVKHEYTMWIRIFVVPVKITFPFYLPEGFYPKPIYSQAYIQSQISQYMFGKQDVVSVGYNDFQIFGRTFTKATVTCNTPFLYQGLDWQPITVVFSDIVSGGKIKLQAEESMVKDVFDIWNW
jgi:hypothetical protein